MDTQIKRLSPNQQHSFAIYGPRLAQGSWDNAVRESDGTVEMLVELGSGSRSPPAQLPIRLILASVATLSPLARQIAFHASFSLSTSTQKLSSQKIGRRK